MKRMHRSQNLALVTRVAALLLAVAAAPAWAQTASAAHEPNHAEPHKHLSADEVAKQLANPNNSLAQLVFRNQFRWYDGDLPNASDQNSYTMLFQPIFPFPLKPTASGGKANLFVRPAIPLLVDQPVPTVNNGAFSYDKISALGDIGFDVAYGVTEKSGLLWAYGMVGTLPAASKHEVAGKQLRLGPEGLLAQFTKTSVLGIFPSHQWNVAGWGENKSYSTTQVQFFGRYLPGGGWSIGTTPIMDYNWKTKDWTVPLNLTISKTVKAGDTPVKLEVEVNYYVESPDAFGPKWMIGLNITPVVRNVLVDLFK